MFASKSELYSAQQCANSWSKLYYILFACMWVETWTLYLIILYYMCADATDSTWYCFVVYPSSLSMSRLLPLCLSLSLSCFFCSPFYSMTPHVFQLKLVFLYYSQTCLLSSLKARQTVAFLNRFCNTLFFLKEAKCMDSVEGVPL